MHPAPPTLGSRKRRLGELRKETDSSGGRPSGGRAGHHGPGTSRSPPHGPGRSGRGNPGPGGSKGQPGEPENYPCPPRPAPHLRRPRAAQTRGWTDGLKDAQRSAGRAGTQTPPRPPGSRRVPLLGSGRGLTIRKWADTLTPFSGHWAGPGRACPALSGAGVLAGTSSNGLLPDSAPEGRPVC